MRLRNFLPKDISNIERVNLNARNHNFMVAPGNFHHHIITALKARENWSQVEETLQLKHVNFYWRPINMSYKG